MVIQAPQSARPEKRRPRPKEPPASTQHPAAQGLHSKLSLIFEENRFPEPIYYRNVDCMGIPSLLSASECKKIIDFAEASMSFRDHFRMRVVDMSYADLIDPCFADALWKSGIFLNSGCPESESVDFEGGVSVFHVPFKNPVMFYPRTGMALLYPQGELCTPQEESEVTFGTKYVLRADVLFRSQKEQRAAREREVRCRSP
eukprot:Skav208945  [mRNA]  locus=scaffold1580:7956:11791:- [translate_table: standard]